MNEGKKFEQDFEKSLAEQGDILVSWDRFYDATGGYASVANICDYVVYRMPYLFYFELKSVQGIRFDFGNIPSGKFRGLTRKQYEGLLEKSSLVGVRAGLLIEFRGTVLRQYYFVPIEVIKEISVRKSSIDVTDAANDKRCVRVHADKKRTRYRLRVHDMLNDINAVKMGGH